MFEVGEINTSTYCIYWTISKGNNNFSWTTVRSTETCFNDLCLWQYPESRVVGDWYNADIYNIVQGKHSLQKNDLLEWITFTEYLFSYHLSGTGKGCSTRSSVMADQKRFLMFWVSAISTCIIYLVLFPYLFCTVLPCYFHISFSQCLCQC